MKKAFRHGLEEVHVRPWLSISSVPRRLRALSLLEAALLYASRGLPVCSFSHKPSCLIKLFSVALFHILDPSQRRPVYFLVHETIHNAEVPQGWWSSHFVLKQTLCDPVALLHPLTLEMLFLEGAFAFPVKRVSRLISLLAFLPVSFWERHSKCLEAISLSS